MSFLITGRVYSCNNLVFVFGLLSFVYDCLTALVQGMDIYKYTEQKIVTTEQKIVTTEQKIVTTKQKIVTTDKYHSKANGIRLIVWVSY